MEQFGHQPPDTVVLPSLRESLWQEDQDFLQEVEHSLQLLALGFVGSFLSEVLLRVHEGIVDNEVDVRVVGVEELDDVGHIGIIQEQSEMLK